MPGKVIGKRMNLGYAGKISRDADVIVENRVVKDGTPEIAFGKPVKLNSDNTYEAFGATGTATVFAGIAVSGVKQATDYYSDEVAYKANEKADVLVRGSATIVCSAGVPTAGGKVYVRIAEDTGKAIGDWEAKAVAGENVEITNMRWTTGYVDANKVAEVTILERMNP